MSAGPTIGRHVIVSAVIPHPDPTRSPLQLAATLNPAPGEPVRYVVGYMQAPVGHTDAVQATLSARPDLSRSEVVQAFDLLASAAYDLAGVARATATRYAQTANPTTTTTTEEEPS